MKSKNIKKLIRYSWCFLFYSGLVWGQGDMGRIMTKASPEAGTTANNNSSVDMYRGKMNSSIPIYNYKGREMDLPISLNYTASGIKVDQVASNVGLGWDLNVGGRLTRVVNGYADDTYGSNPCASATVETYAEDGAGLEVPNNPVKRYDYYKVNALGYEDVFHFINFSILSSIKSVFSELNFNDAGKDKGNGAEWIYTADDHTKFYFGQDNTQELSTTQSTNTGCNSGTLTSATAWMLTKIVSKNQLDEYTFTYQNFEWATTIPNNGEGYVEIGGTPDYRTYGSNYKITQQMLTAIYHNGMKIISFDYANRDDLTFVGGAGNALSHINFYNFNSLTPYRTVGFTYSYFGNATSTDILVKRLKLDQLTFYGVDTNGVRTAGDNYQLEYNSPNQVPRIDSYARDYLGLYNGKDTNTDLIENLILPNTALKLTPSESKRAYSYANSIIGTLKKITYPTKGSTEFEYEQNAQKGGFGTTYSLTGNSYHAASIVNAEMCGSIPPQLTELNSSMLTVNFGVFYGCPSNQVGQTFHTINAKTTYLHLNSPSYIKTGGIGLYLIQKTTQPPSPYIPVTYPYCEYATINSNQYYLEPPTPFRLDMQPTNSIYYTSTNTYSNPQDFVRGGLTTATSIQTGFSTLPAGDYQITVWKFEESGSDYPYVYTLNNNIYEIYDNSTTSFQLVDHNTTSGLIDGFRIKSITHYDATNHFAGKKGYRYNFDGSLYFNCLKNNYSTNVNGYTRNFLSSKAYANENEIIHYNTVYEVSLDSNNQNIGYVANSFGMTTSDEVFPSTTDPTVYFYYNLSKIDFITGKKVYSATGKLLHEENYSIDSQNYNSEMVTAYTMPYYYMSKKESIDYVDPIQNKKITNTVDYSYQYDQLWTKTTNNAFVENFEYHIEDVAGYNYQNNTVTDIKSNIKGDTHYVYNAYTSTATPPVTRYLVSEVQQAATTGGALETKVKYEYDDDGNQVETIQFTPGVIEDNRFESVLWGYNNRFPVAKLTGVKYSLIDANKINAIKNASNLPATAANEAALRTLLEALRGDFPDALITTYTFNPVYGVTSVTDAKGYTLYTDYDVFGRVTFTKEKDDQGNFRILSENQYNTRPN